VQWIEAGEVDKISASGRESDRFFGIADRKTSVVFRALGGASGVSMRPKIAMWSDYGAPRHKHWRSPSRRSGRSSIGPKILVAAVVVVASVIGISGIYPEIIDSESVQGPAVHSQRVAHSEPTPTPRRSGIVAEIPLPPRRAMVTTGEAVATPPEATSPTSDARAAAVVAAPAPAPSLALFETPSSGATIEQAQAADPDAALAIADVSKTHAIADPPAKPAVVRPAQRYVTRAPVAKRRVVRTEHHRGSSGAYAQYGGGWGGGWSGWPGLGNPYHF
jgi:hypothetical protein